MKCITGNLVMDGCLDEYLSGKYMRKHEKSNFVEKKQLK